MILSKPIGVKITLSDICNQKCTFCYNSGQCQTFDGVRRADFDRLSETEYAEKYRFCSVNLEQMMDIFGRNDIMYAKFTGGEPMMTPDLLELGLKKAKQHGMRKILNTNLSLLNDRMLSAMVDSGLEKLNVTFISDNPDEFNRVTRSQNYQLVLENIRRAKREGFNMEIAFPVSTLNIDSIYSTSRFILEELGIRRVNIFPIDPTDVSHISISPSNKDIEKMFKEMERVRDTLGMQVGCVSPFPLCVLPDIARYWEFVRAPCKMGVEEMSFNLKGEIKACTATNQTYGNILTDGFSRVIDVHNRFKRDRQSKRDICPAECRDCSELERCTLGCKSSNEIITGQVYGKNRFATSPLKSPIQPTEKILEIPRGSASIDFGNVSIRKEFPGVYTVLTDDRFDNLNETELGFLRRLSQTDAQTINSVVYSDSSSNPILGRFLSKIYGLGILKVEGKTC